MMLRWRHCQLYFSGSFATWLPAGSCPWEVPAQREPGLWEERRAVLHAVQLLQGIPPAAAESTTPRATHLWSDCRCQVPTAVLPKHNYVAHLPGICPATWGASQEDAISSLLWPQSQGWCCLQSLISVLPWCPLCNQFPVPKLLPVLGRMVSACWLDPGYDNENEKLKCETAPASCHVAETGVDLLLICTEVHVQ